MAEKLMQRGYYSILRWTSDPTRDEARNVAVLLVDAEGQFGGLRAAPISALSSNLRQQGLLDSLLQGLTQQFEAQDKPDLGRLTSLQLALSRSLYLTEPAPVAVPDPGTTLVALYRAYVAPKPSPRAETKGVLLDQVVTSLRQWGYTTRRAEYFGDHLFDAIVDRREGQAVVEVLSFASSARDWSGAERDAGHFLYATEQVGVPGAVVIKAPTDRSRESALTSYERVHRWLDKAHVPTVASDRLEDLEAVLAAKGGGATQDR
jgi:hypothetical protein